MRPYPLMAVVLCMALHSGPLSEFHVLPQPTSDCQYINHIDILTPTPTRHEVFCRKRDRHPWAISPSVNKAGAEST